MLTILNLLKSVDIRDIAAAVVQLLYVAMLAFVVFRLGYLLMGGK